MRKNRIKLVLAGAGAAGVLALAGSASAFAAQGTLPAQNLQPGQEACIGAAATSSVAVAGTAQAPGLKFKLTYSNGTVAAATSGPALTFAPYIYPGAVGWQGPGDYTACAKNNGTQTVMLNYLTIQTS